MMIILAYTIIVLSVLIYWKRLHQKYVDEKFKFALFGLRDELRMLAIRGVIDESSRIFDFYDGSISKTIARRYYLTFPWLMALYLRHGRSAKLNSFSKEIEQETVEIPELLEIRNKLIHYTHHYLVDQHYVTFKIVSPFVYLAIGTKMAKDRFREVVTSTYINPETSLSEKYTMEHAVC